MRSPLYIAIAAAGLLMHSAPCGAQSSGPPTISVDGQAAIMVVPDEVVLSIGVETTAMEVAAATRDNEQKVVAIAAAAQKAGVPKDRIKSDFLSIEPRYRDDSVRASFVGYFVRRSVTITVNDLSAFESLLSAILSSGANYVHGIEFRTTELRRHRDDARRLAVLAAREKAQALAAALGQHIGPAVKVQEGYSGWWSPYNAWWGARSGLAVQNVVRDAGPAGADDSESTIPGRISVSATVNVSFELLK